MSVIFVCGCVENKTYFGVFDGFQWEPAQSCSDECAGYSYTKMYVCDHCGIKADRHHPFECILSLTTWEVHACGHACKAAIFLAGGVRPKTTKAGLKLPCPINLDETEVGDERTPCDTFELPSHMDEDPEVDIKPTRKWTTSSTFIV